MLQQSRMDWEFGALREKSEVLDSISQFWTVFPSFGRPKPGKIAISHFFPPRPGKIGFGPSKTQPCYRFIVAALNTTLPIYILQA